MKTPVEKRLHTITERTLLNSFPAFWRAFFWMYTHYLASVSDDAETQSTLNNLKADQKQRNSIVFFDHNYAFDPFPAAIGVSRQVQIHGVRGPYAGFLELGVAADGQKTVYHDKRTAVFGWVTRRMMQAHPNLQLFPVLREFELRNRNIFPLVRKRFKGANKRFASSVEELLDPAYEQEHPGEVLFLAPMAGLALNNPMLHPEMFALFQNVAETHQRELDFYLVGAYPNKVFGKHRALLPPLLTPHTVFASGSHPFPMTSYADALLSVDEAIEQMRERAHWDPAAYRGIFFEKLQDK